MVGKSNKFDFTNRSNSGVNLARVIGDAFTKELEKAKKDATRQANKLRKQSSDGTTIVDSSKDISVHIIDMRVPGKELGDKGIEVMVQSMTEALKAGTKDASLSLQHINLRDNGLTTLGLCKLAPVIRAACKELKTLNLSDNAIKVEDSIQALQFEGALRALRMCHARCYVDLSGNKELGGRAWEVFARVFSKHSIVRGPAAQHQSLTASRVARTAAEECYEDEDDPPNRIRPLPVWRFRDTLPYLNIADTGLDDAGALWLSFFKPGQAVTCDTEAFNVNLPDAGNETVLGKRVDWQLTGDTLGKDGLQLLRLIEDLDAPPEVQTIVTHPQRAASQDKPRRASGRQSTNAVADYNDVIVVRHKIQRHVIHHLGAHQVKLWQLALLTVSVSRVVFLLATDTSHRSARSDSKTDEDMKQDILTAEQAVPVRARQSTARVIRITNSSPVKAVTNAVQLTAPLTDVSNYSLPKDRLSTKSSAAKMKTTVDTLTATLDNTKLINSAAPNRYYKWQQDKYASKLYADDTVACRLPYMIFQKIFHRTYVLQTAVPMDWAKLEHAYRWGQDRATLATEREWIKMTESAQILTLLDHVKCLSYVE